MKIIWKGEGEPPHTMQHGMMDTIELPDEATQRLGFEHEHAGLILLNNAGFKALNADGSLEVSRIPADVAPFLKASDAPIADDAAPTAGMEDAPTPAE